MANTAINVRAPLSIWRTLAAPFVAAGNFLVAIGEASNRAKQVEFLNAMTDEELAARGMTRETIVRHVFSDKMGI